MSSKTQTKVKGLQLGIVPTFESMPAVFKKMKAAEAEILLKTKEKFSKKVALQAFQQSTGSLTKLSQADTKDLMGQSKGNSTNRFSEATVTEGSWPKPRPDEGSEKGEISNFLIMSNRLFLDNLKNVVENQRMPTARKMRYTMMEPSEPLTDNVRIFKCRVVTEGNYNPSSERSEPGLFQIPHSQERLSHCSKEADSYRSNHLICLPLDHKSGRNSRLLTPKSNVLGDDVVPVSQVQIVNKGIPGAQFSLLRVDCMRGSRRSIRSNSSSNIEFNKVKEKQADNHSRLSGASSDASHRTVLKLQNHLLDIDTGKLS